MSLKRIFGNVVFYRHRRLAWLVLLVGCLGLLSLLMALRTARLAAGESVCSGNLTTIASLLRSYRIRHGALPPAVVNDDRGRPLHSWRMLLVRSEMPEEFGRYDLSEPWNGPNNRQFADPMPSFFRCPNDNGSNRSLTSYVMVGHSEKSISPSNDGNDVAVTSDLVLIVEVADSTIHWMEPRDIGLDLIESKDSDLWVAHVRSHDPSGPGVIFADLGLFRLNPATVDRSGKLVKELLTGKLPHGVNRGKLVEQGVLIQAIRR